MATFYIKANDKYLHVPDCEAFDVVLNSNPCSIWNLDKGILRWNDRPHLCLAIENDRLCLNSDPSKAWKYGEKNVKLAHAKTSGSIEIQKTEDHHSIEFELEHAQVPKPATSCHLRYDFKNENISNSWSLECTVKVQRSADCTYFCVTGFGPGGYAGIQQLPGNERKAIFSMWNQGNNSVELVESGDNVVVSKFGGEGTGIKTMKTFHWKESENITFKIDGELKDGFWFCKCQFFSGQDSKPQLMARLKRSAKAGNPLYSTGFYSFIEDWNRFRDATGYKNERKAQFLWPKINGKFIRDATFTKVENGCDAFAADFARGMACQHGFMLQTGTDIVKNNTCLHTDD